MINYLITNIKMIFRIPLTVFFSIVYPIMMMFIIVFSYGNIDIGEGFHLIDKYFIISIGLGILPLSLVSFPVWIASEIQDNSMKRMQYFRVSFFSIICSDIIAFFLIGIFSMIIDTVLGFLVFGLKIPNILYFLCFYLQCFISLVVYMLLGGLIAITLKKVHLVMPCGLVLMFALYMICGAFISYDELPDTIKSISAFMPMKYAMIDFFNVWNESQLFNSTFLLLSLLYVVIISSLLLLVFNKRYKR